MTGAKAVSVPLSNAFIGKTASPNATEVKAALGAAKPLWDRLLEELADELGLTTSEWGSSSPKLGWSLRVKHRDRIVVYLAPLDNRFRASFALGEKAVKAALASGIPAATVHIIEIAKKYAEGRAVRIDISTAEDVAVVKKLAAAKLAG